MTLDEDLKAADADRWLSSRLVGDPPLRGALVGLYRLDHELSRVPRTVKDPLMADIRLAWWREALEDAAGAGAGRHPAIGAVAAAVRNGRIDAAPLAALAEARRAELEPFADEPALAAHLRATGGVLLGLAARLLAPAVDPRPLAEAGVAWGWLKTPLRPLSWAEAVEDEIDAHRLHRAAAALAAARPALAGLPTEAFPAIAHLALVAPYAAGRTPSELGKRWRMLRASLSGRV